MAPISQGFMHAELRPRTLRSSGLNIVLLGFDRNYVSDFCTKIEILHDYLHDIELPGLVIKVHVSNRQYGDSLNRHTSITIHDRPVSTKEEVLEFLESVDADLLLDAGRVFTKIEVFQNRENYCIVQERQGLIEQVESYLTGWEVPWAIDEPVWHTNWLLKYIRTGTFGQRVFDFMGLAQRKQYTSEQIQYIRELANKITHVDHSKQMLNYYLIQRRYAHRRGNLDSDYHFELVHQLNNYYFFISSGLDILARLLNDMYRLGYTKYQNYTLDKPDFLGRLGQKRKGIIKIVTLKKYAKWMDLMKLRRNSLAHESNIYLTPMVQQKQQPLTDAELELKVDQAMDWQYAASVMSPAAIENMRAVVKQNLDIEENYEKVVSDMMIVERTDRTTGQVEKLIFFPLRAIQNDYDTFKEIITRCVDNLTKARKPH